MMHFVLNREFLLQCSLTSGHLGVLSLFDLKHIRGWCINFAVYKCFYSIQATLWRCISRYVTECHTETMMVNDISNVL